jgi:hypothetical protein
MVEAVLSLSSASAELQTGSQSLFRIFTLRLGGYLASH